MTLYKMPPKNAEGPSFGEVVKFSFASGLGVMGSIVIFTFLGLLFLVPGIYLVMTEKKKPSNERSTGKIIIGIVLIVVGCALGLGLGISFLGTGIETLVDSE